MNKVNLKKRKRKKIRKKKKERDWGGRGRWRGGGRQGRKVPGYWKPDLAMTHLLIWFVGYVLLCFIFPSLPWAHSSIHSASHLWSRHRTRSWGSSMCSLSGLLFPLVKVLLLLSLSFWTCNPTLEALSLNHWTTGEVPLPSQLFPAHIQADFPQWPCGLNSGLSPFLESVSNASATPDNPKPIPPVFLFQGLCSLESRFLPKRHLLPTVYLQWKKPGDVRCSPSHQLLTLSRVIRGRTIKNLQSLSRRRIVCSEEEERWLHRGTGLDKRVIHYKLRAKRKKQTKREHLVCERSRWVYNPNAWNRVWGNMTGVRGCPTTWTVGFFGWDATLEDLISLTRDWTSGPNNENSES